MHPRSPRHQAHPHPAAVGGRHENGQNFLADQRVVRDIVAAVRRPAQRRIIELGAGDGALTTPLAALGVPLTAVELDPRLVRRLRDRLGDRVRVEGADMLHIPLPHGCDVVSNVPYHLTTPLLRRLLASPSWHTATLLVQWEVARKRAAVGGTTLLTAQWWPWYEFRLLRRVGARSFRPVPSVDSGLLRITRRAEPLLAWRDRGSYRRLVSEVFTSPGSDVRAMARRAAGSPARPWTRAHGIAPGTLPKHVGAEAWADLFRRVATRGG